MFFRLFLRCGQLLQHSARRSHDYELGSVTSILFCLGQGAFGSTGELNSACGLDMCTSAVLELITVALIHLSARLLCRQVYGSSEDTLAQNLQHTLYSATAAGSCSCVQEPRSSQHPLRKSSHGFRRLRPGLEECCSNI